MTAQGIIVAAVFIGLVVWAASRWWWARHRSQQSLGWPLVKANIEYSSIEERPSGESGTAFVIVLGFAYFAAREHGGLYEESFPTHAEASHMLRVYREGPFLVRYNLANPSDYFLDSYRDVRL